MKFKLIKYLCNISISVTIILFLVQCENRDYHKKYYNNDHKVWSEYLKAIGVAETNLDDTILLVINSSMCSPCERELQYWHKFQNNSDKAIKVIVVEKYLSAFRYIVSKYDNQFDAYQDSTAHIFKHDLIPVTPIKLYFDENSNVEMIYPMGTGGKLNHFVENLSK